MAALLTYKRLRHVHPAVSAIRAQLIRWKAELKHSTKIMSQDAEALLSFVYGTDLSCFQMRTFRYAVNAYERN